MFGDELIGRQLASYQIEGVAGRGTVGVVYRALDSNDQKVALKVFYPPPGIDAKVLLARFERESQVTTRLNHPHIMRVLDAGQADGRVYMAMPLIESDTLDALLKKKQRLTELMATEICWQIADALNDAHLQNLVHRDVKPSNILVTDDGHAMLADFGVVYALDDPGLTQAGHIVGTPAYMAPEQAVRRKKLDGRADIYSLGVVLYRMIVGRLPFRGSTPELLHAHAYETPPLPSVVSKVSHDVEAIILQAMEKDPDKRFQSGREMAQDLLRLNNHLREQKNQKLNWQKIYRRFRFRLKRLLPKSRSPLG